MNALSEAIRVALADFASDLRSVAWYGRENELVNWFAHGHLMRVVADSGTSLDPMQIGIEVAVPQIAEPTARHRRDVRKDLVIWRRPKQTCWIGPRQHGEPPLAILEWKSMNNVGVPESEPKKRREFAADVNWLRAATRRSPDLLGYAVFVDLRPTTPKVEYQGVIDGKAAPVILI